MKIKTKKLFALTLATLFFPTLTNAQAPDQLTIINNFDKAINFTIGTNPETLPDLAPNFTLQPKDRAYSKVLDQKQAYIHGEDAPDQTGKKDNVFFGVGLKNNHVDLHGYISHGIAFSMNKGVVVFCKPEDYKPHHSCE